MAKLTKAQQQALLRVYRRQPLGISFLAFRRTVQGPIYRSDPCVMVQWCGMWLGIEPDGYTHS